MKETKVSKDEQVGYHKGSINILIAERNEMLRIASLTESLIKAHIEELGKLGVILKENSKAK